jgi:lipid II:glycine glycyltransferase (peptidoglycan interpeptide bridge formation enzyme)
MWEAISWCTANGFKSLSFGRTEPENQGLLQFKRGWGTEEKIINYYKYDFAKKTFIKGQPGVKSSYKFFKIMPSPLLRLTGNLLYRHVG